MIDTKQKITPATKADPTEMLLAEVEVRDKDPHQPHRKKTSGELAFDRGVYTGIGFVANEASAIVIADEFEHGIGKKWFESISEAMVKNLKFQDTIEKGITTTAKSKASNLLLWGSLLISGTLLVLPMKLLEDNKGEWVKKANHWFDRRHGKAMTPEEVEARDKEVENALACEGKQTWPSMIFGRAIAVCTALGLGKAIGPHGSEKMKNWSEKLLTGSVQTTKNRAHRYAAIASLETLSCAATSIMLEISSKLVAKRGVQVRNPELCTSLVHEQLHEQLHADTASGSSDKPATTGSDANNITQTTSVTPVSDTDKFAHLKKKPMVKMDTHVDAAKATDTSFSLAT